MEYFKREMERKSEFYRVGNWVIEIEETGEGTEDNMLSMYVGLVNYGHRMFCFGLPFHQPHAKDGKTEYTKDELMDIFEANFPEYMNLYRGEVADLEWGAENRLWGDDECGEEDEEE